MSNSALGTLCETVVINLLKQQAALASYPAFHWNEDKEASADCIVVEVNQGAHQQEGPGCFLMAGEVTVRSAVHDPERGDAIYKAIRAALESTGAVEGTDAFSVLILQPENMSDDRSTTKNLRRWRVTIPVLAKAA